MLFGFLSTYSILIITHLLGVVIGAGSAFMTDAMFFNSIKDRRISNTEMSFLRLGSKMVWIGILIIVASGATLFFRSPQEHLASARFMAKMTIVAIIIINGAVFHFFHLPHLQRHTEIHFPSSPEFMKRVPFLSISGVISMVSWVSAIFLGSLRSLPFSYSQVISVYVAIIVFGSIVALSLKKRLFN
jgi:hypothetical protein